MHEDGRSFAKSQSKPVFGVPDVDFPFFVPNTNTKLQKQAKMHFKLYILFLTVISVYLALASPVPTQADIRLKRDDINVPAKVAIYKRPKTLNTWVEFCEEGGVNCVGYINPYNNKCFTIFGKKNYIRFHSNLLLDRNSFTLNTASLDYKPYCPKDVVAAQTFTRPQINTLLKIDNPGVKYYFTYPY